MALMKWIHTDRDNLKTKQSTVEEFIQEIVTKIANLLPHHYIAKHQINYRKETKNKKKNLAFGKLAFLMDFAENYAFIVHDTVLGFHWENSQTTLQPIVVYY